MMALIDVALRKPRESIMTKLSRVGSMIHTKTQSMTRSLSLHRLSLRRDSSTKRLATANSIDATRNAPAASTLAESRLSHHMSVLVKSQASTAERQLEASSSTLKVAQSMVRHVPCRLQDGHWVFEGDGDEPEEQQQLPAEERTSRSSKITSRSKIMSNGSLVFRENDRSSWALKPHHRLASQPIPLPVFAEGGGEGGAEKERPSSPRELSVPTSVPVPVDGELHPPSAFTEIHPMEEAEATSPPPEERNRGTVFISIDRIHLEEITPMESTALLPEEGPRRAALGQGTSSFKDIQGHSRAPLGGQDFATAWSRVGQMIKEAEVLTTLQNQVQDDFSALLLKGEVAIQSMMRRRREEGEDVDSRAGSISLPFVPNSLATLRGGDDFLGSASSREPSMSSPEGGREA